MNKTIKERLEAAKNIKQGIASIPESKIKKIALVSNYFILVGLILGSGATLMSMIHNFTYFSLGLFLVFLFSSVITALGIISEKQKIKILQEKEEADRKISEENLRKINEDIYGEEWDGR